MAEYNAAQTSPSLSEVSIITVADTYLASPNGDMVAGISPLGPIKKQKKQRPVLLFGKFKKFGKSPQEVVKVVWTELGVEKKQRLKRAKLASRVESAFRYRSSLLPRKTKLKIKGDMKALMLQAEYLLASEDIKETPEAEKRGEKDGPQIAPQSENSRREITEAERREEQEQEVSIRELASKVPERERKEAEQPQSGMQRPFMPSSRKRQGQEFQPTKIEPKHEAKQEPKEQKLPPPEGVEVEILKDGCRPRLDEIQELAIIQTRSITRKGGTVIKQEPCSDSNEHYPIRRTYDGCDDKLDKDQELVYPQYRRYWVDGQGELHEVDRTCVPDQENPLELIEDEKACELISDLGMMTAQRMAELYYKDRKKRRIVVEECRPLTGSPVLRLEKVVCGYRHDFDRELSFPQSRIIALQQGQEIRITPCADDGDGIPHQISTVGCDPIVERDSGRRFVQIRTIIETPQGPVLITGCRPSQELQETFEGCEAKFDHDIEAGQSRGYTRFFHDIRDIKTFVTDCMPSNRTFHHQHRLVGYEHDDIHKISKPKTEIFIEVPYAGVVLVDSAKIRVGDRALPYVPKEIREELDPRKTRFEGCFKITSKKRIQIYTRPDQTLFEEIIGEGAPERSHNLCVTTEETQQSKSCSWAHSYHGGRPSGDRIYPGGSSAGWLSCSEAAGKITNWLRGNGSTFRLYYYLQAIKRTKTAFPSGEIHYSPWQVFGPAQMTQEQSCPYG